MSFWSRRPSDGDLEARLRASRPQAPSGFVDALSGRAGRRPALRSALAFALVLTSLLLASLAAFGGISSAARAVTTAVSSATSTLTQSSTPTVQTNTPAADQYGDGFHGCTPGYWQQTQHFFAWGNVSQNASFNTTFGVTAAQSGFPNSFTLLDALQEGGGMIDALARHAVAAYLNSLRPGMNFPYTTQQVINMVKTAIVSGSATKIEETKNKLEAANQLGGPLC
jgi:hypothetical protein